MDGFAKVTQGQMLYYDESEIPFYYSFANAFTVGNRWFCSAPCQTYPNRRFYLAGTAFGLISTDTSKVSQSPPNGTIFDRLNAHGISWKDYFVDVPGTAVILDVPQNNPQQHGADLAVLRRLRGRDAPGGELRRSRDRRAERASAPQLAGTDPDRQRRRQLHRRPRIRTRRTRPTSSSASRSSTRSSTRC